MKFKPTPYRQPITGDARCALYSIANLIGDRGPLLFNNVNQKTNHIQEASYLRQWFETAIQYENVSRLPIFNIYPFAIAAPGSKIEIAPDILMHISSDEGKYILALIDFDRSSGVHTMGCLWGHGEDCILVDPQNEFPAIFQKSAIFKVFDVVGIRWLTDSGMAPPEFSKDQLSHLISTI